MPADLSLFRTRRLERGWTLLELSRRVGVPVGCLSDLERGKGASAAVLERLAEVYGEPLASPPLLPGLQDLLARPGVQLSGELVARLSRLEFRSGQRLSADEWAALAASLSQV